MNRKIIWMVVSGLMALSLVMAACGPAEEEVGGEIVEEEVVEAEVPKYGGTLSMKWSWVNNVGEEAWDIVNYSKAWGFRVWGAPFFPTLLIGDIEKYGPRGSNASPFEAFSVIPEQFVGGSMAESWEVSPERIIFHIRPGVHFSGREGVMEAREFTAYDAEFSLNRTMTSYTASGKGAYEYIESITATDKYTLVVETNSYNADWSFHLGYGWMAPIIPEEVVKAGPNNWRNHSGTGPFIITDHVDGVQATYERNPNYWEKTTIDGKEYQLPFIDRLVNPVIVDTSTRVAALRTGKIDWDIAIPFEFSASLAAENPDLIQKKYETWPTSMSLPVDKEPWNNRNVRRALMIGTDWETVLKSVYSEGTIHSFPANKQTPYYTPISQLPASAQLLYSNDPVLARQMLDEAGIPDGFKMQIYVSSKDLPAQDVVTVLSQMWKEIGIEIEMLVEQGAVINAKNSAREITGGRTGGMNNTNPSIFFRAMGIEAFRGWFWAGYDDQYYLEQYEKMRTTMDVAERTALIKELSIFFLEDAAYIPFPARYIVNAHWPWVKNYYGEAEAGVGNFTPMTSRIWIDQDLKESMGY
jgi:peptide/nickel transport system substrate-binding protein